MVKKRRAERIDGRKSSDIRRVRLKRGVMKYAEGSCLIEMGNTKVMCAASIEDGVPPFLRGKDTGWITSEYGMLPRSCNRRIARESSRGKVGGRTHEIQRLIGRSMRSVIDLDAIPEKTIWIDCDVIQGDGGTRTASITGAYVALIEALSRLKKKGMFSKIPVSGYVAAVSVGIIDGIPMLDLCYEEDSRADVDMNCVITDRGEYIEVQGTAEREPFSAQQLSALLKLADKGVKELIREQKKSLKGII